MTKKLTQQNAQTLEMPKALLAELLPDLYFWSASDFGGWTVDELIELVTSKLLKEKQDKEA